MGYLLDTHILLWWLADAGELKKKVKSIIADPNNLIFVSAVSTWEIAIKKSIGKLSAPDNLEQVIINSGFNTIPIYINHTLYVDKLENLHDDPFDRLLISQAILEDFIFITADKKIARYNRVNLMPA